MRSGGRFYTYLEELQAAGFVEVYTPYGRSKRDRFVRVIDEYSLFYLRWIETFSRSRGLGQGAYWQSRIASGVYHSWAGSAFEAICLKHVSQIKAALGISGIVCDVGAWRGFASQGKLGTGVQIDLLFDRGDDVISICEIKYSKNQFLIDKAYAKELMKKMEVFEEVFNTSKQLQLVMICSGGLKRGVWQEELVSSDLSLSDLFNF